MEAERLGWREDEEVFTVVLEEQNMGPAWHRAMKTGLLVADQEIGLGGARHRD